MGERVNSNCDRQEPTLLLSNSELTIDNVAESFVADDSLRNQICQAQIVLVPNYVNATGGRLLAYPDGTEQLYRFLQGRFEKSLVEAAISDEDYVEHALHHDEIRLANILLASAEWLPIIVAALNAFITASAGIWQRGANVESEIHYEDSTGKLVSVKYRGPADSFKRTLETLFPDQDAPGVDSEETPDEN